MAQQADFSQAANCDHIPIIDLSNLDNPQIEERRKLAREIYDACTQVGFFYIQVRGFQDRSVGYEGLTRLSVPPGRIMASQKTCSKVSIAQPSSSSAFPMTRR